MLTKWWATKILVFFIPLALQAQLQQNHRLEIPLLRNENSFEVLPTNQEGLLLYRTIIKPLPAFQLIFVDTLFTQKWTGILEVDPKLQLIQKIGSGNKAYFLFHRKDFSDINFTLYEVDLPTRNFKRYVIRNFIPFLPTHLVTTSNGALIGGYFLGRIPVILFFDFASTKSKVLPGLFNEAGELIQIKSNPDDSFNVIINAKNPSRQKTLWIKSYNANGDLIQNAVLEPEENYSLLFGRIITQQQGNQLIAGVYANRNSDFSRGLFLARVDSEYDQQLFYYPFTDLDNFFKYMKAKREKRVTERIARRKIKNKKIRLQYRFLVHEFVPHKNEYILLGEAFYPRYKQMQQYGYGNMPGVQAVFDGYQYTHAIIIGFNSAGDLLWDNSFEINDVRTFTLEQFVKMDVQEDRIALLYLYNDKIRSKIIQNNTVLEGKVFNQLNMEFEEATSSEDGNVSKLEYWYGDCFFAYGTQSIPHSKFRRQPRESFVISKVRYR